MKTLFLISLFTFFIIKISFSQCPNLNPVLLPFYEDFENYSDTLYNDDTLFCSSNFRWTFNASNSNGRVIIGTTSPYNNGGDGGATFDVNAANVFNTNELILTLNLSNYNLTDPVFLSFDCNNVADEPHIEDRIYIRGNENSPWIEVYNWSTLPPNQWKSERKNIQTSIILGNNSQNYSSSFQVKFSQKDNYGYPSDGFAIDNIALEVISCPKAQNFSLDYQNQDTAIISWNNSTNSNWNIEYGLKGFQLGQGTMVKTTNNTDTISQLLNNSIYDFYIQSNCGNNDLSIWEGPLTVYTTISNDSSCSPVFIAPDGIQNLTHNYNTDLQFGEEFILNNSPKNTIWFKTVIPNSGHLAIETCNSLINTELGAYYIPNDCTDFTTFNEIEIASFSSASTQNICNSPGKAALELCGFSPGDSILFWIGSYTTASEGEINFTVYDYSVFGQAGDVISNSLELCSSDSINLFTNIDNYSKKNNWKWEYIANPNAIQNDSILISSLTTYGSNTISYIVSNICNSDTSTFTIDVSETNYAGTPISGLEYCNTSDIFLLNGLTGLIETTGNWYNSNDEPINSSTFMPSENDIGSYTFSYIVDQNNCEPDTSILTIELLNCTDIKDQINEEHMNNVYPNPANNIIYVNYFLNNRDEAISIQFYNGMGQIVKTIATSGTKGNNNTEITTEGLSSGIYTVRIISNEKTISNNIPLVIEK